MLRTCQKCTNRAVRTGIIPPSYQQQWSLIISQAWANFFNISIKTHWINVRICVKCFTFAWTRVSECYTTSQEVTQRTVVLMIKLIDPCPFPPIFPIRVRWRASWFAALHHRRCSFGEEKYIPHALVKKVYDLLPLCNESVVSDSSGVR